MLLTNTATPFWLQLSTVLRYPLQAAPRNALLLLLGTVIFGELTVWFFPPSAVLPVLVAIVFFRYAYWTMLEAAEGDLQAGRHGFFDASLQQSGFGHELSNWLFVKQLIAFALFGLTVAFAEQTGEVAGHLAVWISSLAMPANVICLGMTRSLRSSLNPLALIAIMRAFGLPYLTLFGLSWVFLETLLQVLGWVLAFSGWLWPPLFSLIAGYFLLAIMYLFGLAMHQYASALGYQPRAEARAEALAAHPVQASDSLSAAQRYIEQGDLSCAVNAAAQAVRQQPQSLVAHRLYHGLLRETQQADALAQHASEFVPLLFACQKNGEALRVMGCITDVKARQKVLPYTLAESLPLAALAHRAGQGTLALELIEHALANDRDNPQQPSAHLLAADILWHPLRQKEAAISRLEQLLQNFPKSQAASEAKLSLSIWRVA